MGAWPAAGPGLALAQSPFWNFFLRSSIRGSSAGAIPKIAAQFRRNTSKAQS